MEDKEIMALKLGFESTEEMEAYYDLCRGEFKPGIVMTKDLCDELVMDNEWKDLLYASREERLQKKLFCDFGGLVEATKAGDTESIQQLKSLIDFELSELNKCYEIKGKKTL